MADDLSAIQERNRRVEADKAWETSWTRRMVIAAGTYILVTVYLSCLGVANAPLHAVVPAGGYLASTLSLAVIKKQWITRFYRP